MKEPQRPLIPQFSLRWVLGLTTALAVVSLIVSLALRGSPWAGGITVGLAALVFCFLAYAALFALAWLTAGMARARQLRRAARLAKASTPLAERGANPTSALVILTALGLSVWNSSAVWAASGGSTTFPMLAPGQTNTTGLTLTVDTSWVDSCGYRPVSVELKSIAGPVTSDRVLSFRFLAGQWQLDSNTTAVTQTIEIPAGATSAKAIIAVPQWEPWTTCAWTVFEDGQKLKELSTAGPTTFGNGSTSYFGDGAPPSVLALSGLGQISVNHLTVFGQTEETVVFVGWTGPTAMPPPGTQGAISFSGSMAGPGIPFAKDLPTRWIDYSGLDIVLTSQDELLYLIEKYPAQWQAIQTWLRSGGNLVVYGVGEKLEKLAELENRTGMAAEKDVLTATGESRGKGGWILPQKEIRDLPLNGVNNYGVNNFSSGSVQDPGILVDGSVIRPNRPKSLTLENAPFVVHPYGAGTIAAIRSENDFKGNNFSWTWLYNTLGPERWQWHQRHGVSMTNSNGDFWNFLIPGVGAAPILQFQVLITLFVLFIGPVNYYLLKRAGKLNLMVITVPICAVLVTGALFLYALVADGLSVRLRARSLTLLDQRTQQANCWARLSFYAGLSPSGGLKFSDQTVVFPLQSEPPRNGEGQPRELDWRRTRPSDPNSPLEQQLSNGWLNARTPTQFVTARSRKTGAKLSVQQADGQSVPKITNELGVDIQQLLLVDENGKCFTGANIGGDQSAELTAAESQSSAFIKLIQPLMVENEPRIQVVAPNSTGLFGIQGRYRPGMRNYNSANVASALQNTSVLERSMSELRNRLNQDSLPPRSYVAVVETSPEMESGTPSAHEEAGFHVVVGQW